MNPKLRCSDEGELEKFCRQCQEWWPATDEFFYRSARSGNFRSPCKACIADHRRKTWKEKPCCVPGCNQPRYHWRYAR